MRRLAIIGTSVLLLAGATTWADLGSAIQSGADRVVATQHTDGKWGWPIAVPPTYDNITGPIGLGLISAHGRTADSGVT